MSRLITYLKDYVTLLEQDAEGTLKGEFDLRGIQYKKSELLSSTNQNVLTVLFSQVFLNNAQYEIGDDGTLYCKLKEVYESKALQEVESFAGVLSETALKIVKKYRLKYLGEINAVDWDGYDGFVHLKNQLYENASIDLDTIPSEVDYPYSEDEDFLSLLAQPFQYVIKKRSCTLAFERFMYGRGIRTVADILRAFKKWHHKRSLEFYLNKSHSFCLGVVVPQSYQAQELHESNYHQFRSKCGYGTQPVRRFVLDCINNEWHTAGFDNHLELTEVYNLFPLLCSRRSGSQSQKGIFRSIMYLFDLSQVRPYGPALRIIKAYHLLKNGSFLDYIRLYFLRKTRLSRRGQEEAAGSLIENIVYIEGFARELFGDEAYDNQELDFIFNEHYGMVSLGLYPGMSEQEIRSVLSS